MFTYSRKKLNKPIKEGG